MSFLIKNKKIFYLFGIVLFLTLPLLSLAQQPQPTINNLPNGLTFDKLIEDIKDNVLNILWIIAMAFVIIMFVLAGFKFLTAQGDPGKVAEARQSVIWGIAGAVVIVLAWSIIAIVKTQLNV